MKGCLMKRGIILGLTKKINFDFVWKLIKGSTEGLSGWGSTPEAQAMGLKKYGDFLLWFCCEIHR